MPERIQMRRTKGWRLPRGVVNVARPTKWGNPFRVGERIAKDDPMAVFVDLPGGWGGVSSVVLHDPELVVASYMNWLVNNPPLFIEAFAELPGRDLACWCPPSPEGKVTCHADALLAMVNEP